MSRMPYESDFDPIRKSEREANRFNSAWLKNGKRLTWLERIGFAVISFLFFTFGIYFGTLAAIYIRDGGVLGAIGWSIPALIFIVPGILGLRNVCRFQPVDRN
jgi:hypothetical protein